MHDHNFKNMILDYPVQSLEFFAGEEAGSDLLEARIIPVRQEQLKERLGVVSGSWIHRFYRLPDNDFGCVIGRRCTRTVLSPPCCLPKNII